MSKEINCEDNITTGTHIFIAFAGACFAWLLFCVPAMTLLGKDKTFWSIALICFTIFVYCIVISSFIGANETYKMAIYGEETFRLAKLISLVVGILATQACLFYAYFNDGNEKSITILTICVYIVFIANILEAAATSFVNYANNKPEIDKITEVSDTNLYTGIMGIIIAIALAISWYKGSKIGINDKGQRLKLVCNFSWLIIIAYTIWNLLFKIQLIEHPLVLSFFVISLLMPIIAHALNIGDWMQIRALSLLFVMFMEIGFAKGEGSIFPNYNSQGNKEQYKHDILTKIFSHKDFKLMLIILGMIISILSLTNSILF